MKSLLSILTESENKNEVLLENDICPNCWGRQEYDTLMMNAVRDRQIDINNHSSEASRAFIQQFIVKHLDGIRLLKRDNQHVCPACDVAYTRSR